MQANAEAADFIFHRHEFVGNTAELAPRGKDHIAEVAARMRSAPFPVIIERTENNADPELDAFRRDLVAQILTDFGNPDAQQRTIVSPAYGKGINSREAEVDYYRFIYTRGGFGNFGNNFGNGFGNSGGAGGFGGGFGFYSPYETSKVAFRSANGRFLGLHSRNEKRQYRRVIVLSTPNRRNASQ
jgi:hypothetical protein